MVKILMANNGEVELDMSLESFIEEYCNDDYSFKSNVINYKDKFYTKTIIFTNQIIALRERNEESFVEG